MKILFLTIDSVLNHAPVGKLVYDYPERFAHHVPLCADNIENLKYIIENVKYLKIVWSTNWCVDENEMWREWFNPRIWLELQFWMAPILGNTPKFPPRHNFIQHANEIKIWRQFHREYATCPYAVLDDIYIGMSEAFHDNFFVCKHDSGLIREIALRVVEHLNHEQE